MLEDDPVETDEKEQEKRDEEGLQDKFDETEDTAVDASDETEEK